MLIFDEGSAVIIIINLYRMDGTCTSLSLYILFLLYSIPTLRFDLWSNSYLSSFFLEVARTLPKGLKLKFV